MSVVAWDGKTLAADSQNTDSDGCKSRGIKIRRGRRGAILAWVGGQSTGQRMAKWWDAGCDPDDFPACECGGDPADSTQLIVVLKDGSVWTYEHTPEPLQIHETIAAWGSGASYALGAMAAGVTARRACQISKRFDTKCGFEIRSFALEK